MTAARVPITVVIPAFERPAMVRRALRSVWAQTVLPDEVIVVDDASSDDTAEVARASGATVIVHEVNGGEGAARNTGLAAARHEWIALLDSDDEWRPSHVGAVWAAACASDAVLVADVAVGVGPVPEAGRLYGWIGLSPRVLRSPREVAFPDNVIQPSAALVRRSVVEAAGGFPVGRRHAGDLDTWLRVLEHGTGLALPSVGVLYHLHAGQVSSARRQMDDAHRSVLAQYAGRPWHHAGVDRWLAVTSRWDESRGAAVRWALCDPHAALGLARSLLWRRRVRVASRRFAQR